MPGHGSSRIFPHRVSPPKLPVVTTTHTLIFAANFSCFPSKATRWFLGEIPTISQHLPGHLPWIFPPGGWPLEAHRPFPPGWGQRSQMISDDLRIHERWEGPWFHLPGSGTYCAYCPGIVDCSQPLKVCRSIMKFFFKWLRTGKSWLSLVFCVGFCDEKSDHLSSALVTAWFRAVPCPWCPWCPRMATIHAYGTWWWRRWGMVVLAVLAKQ